MEKERSHVSDLENKLEEAEDRVIVSEDALSNLSKEKESLSIENENHIMKLQEANEQILCLTSAKDTLEVSLEKLKSDYETLLAKDSEKSKSFESSETFVEREQLELVVGQLREVTDRKDSLEAANAKLSDSLAKAKKEIQNLESSAIDLQLTVESLQVENIHLSEEVAKFKCEKESLEEILAEAKLENNRSFEEISDLKLKDEEISQLLKEKEQVITENEAKISDLNRHLSLSEARVSELGLAIEEKDSEIKRLESFVEDLSAQSTWLESQMEKLSNNLKDEAENIEPAITKDESILCESAVSTDNENVSQQHRKDLEEELQSLKDQMEAKDIMISELRKTAKSEMFEDGESDFKDYCDQLETEKKLLQQQMSSNEKLLKEKEAKIRSLLEQLEDLQRSGGLQHKEDMPQSVIKTKLSTVEKLSGIKVPSNEQLQNSGDSANFKDTLLEQKTKETSSLNSSFSSVSSDKDKGDKEEDIYDLEEKLKVVTEERNKYKADNKKLLKIGRGKDTKLKLMNENFEQLRKERDELLAERDSLDNKVQDLSTNFLSEFDNSNNVQLEVRVLELESLCQSKDTEIERLSKLLEEQNVSQAIGKSVVEINILSKENEKLRVEAAKLHMIDKGKTAKINQISQDFEDVIGKKNKEIEDRLAKIKEIESLLDEERSVVEKMKAEKEKLHSDYMKAQKVNRGKEAKLKKMEELIEEKESEIARKDNENSSLMEELEELHKTIETLNLKEDNMKSEMFSIEQNVKVWEEKYLEMQKKVSELEEVIAQKDRSIQDLKGNESLVKQLREEKIILEFELDCAKDELNKVKSSFDEEEMKLREISEGVDNVVQEKQEKMHEARKLSDSVQQLGDSPDGNGDKEVQTFSKLSPEELLKKVANLSHENKKLSQEKNKLQKLSKGKEAKLKKFEEYVKEQQKVISEKETDILILQENVKELEDKLILLEDVEQDLRFKLDNAIADVDEWRDHCHDLEDRLDAADEAIDRKNDELDRLEDDMAASREEIENICVERDEMERQRDSLMAELENLKGLLKSKENEVNDLTEKLQCVVAEKEHCNAEIKKLHLVGKGKDAKIKKLEASFTSNENLIDENTSQIASLHNQLQALSLSLEKSNDQRLSLETQLQSEMLTKKHFEEDCFELRNKLEEVQSLIQNRDENIQHLTEICTAWENRCKEFETAYAANKDTLHENENETGCLKAEIESLREKVLMLEKNLSVYEIEKEKQSCEFETLSASLHSSDAEISSLKQLLEEKETSVHMLEQKCQAFEKQFQENMNIIQKKEEIVTTLRKKCLQVDQEQEELRARLSEKEVELFNYLESSKFSSAENSEKHKSELTKLHGVCAEKEQEITELRAKLDEIKTKGIEMNAKFDESVYSSQLEIKKLSEVLIEKDNELKNLKSTLEETISSSSATIEAYEKQSEQINAQLEQLYNEKSVSDQQLSWFSQYHNNTHSKLPLLEQEVLDLQTQLNEKEQILSSSQQCLSEFEKMVSEAQRREQDLSSENEKLQHSLETKETELAQLTDEARKLEEYKKEMQKELSQTQLSAQKAQRKSLEQLATMENQIIHLSEVNSKLEETVASLKVEIRSLKQHISPVFKEDEVVAEDITKTACQMQGAVDQSSPFVAAKEVRAEILTPAEEVRAEILTPIEYQVFHATTPDQYKSSLQITKAPENVPDLSLEVKKLKKLCKGKDAKIKKLEEIIKNSKTEETRVETDSQTMHSNTDSNWRVEQLEKALLETQQDRERYISEVAELKNSSQVLKKELEKAVAVPAATEEYHKKEIQQLQEQIQVMQNELLQSRNESLEARNSLIYYQSTYESLHQQSTDTQENLNAKIKMLEEKMNKSKTEETIVEEDSQNIHSNADLYSRVEQLEKALLETQQDRERYISEVGELKNTCQKLKQELEKAMAVPGAIEESHKGVIQQLQEQMQVMQNELSQSRDESLEVRNSLLNYQSAYETLHQQSTDTEENLRLSVSTLQSEVNHLQNVNSEINEKYQVLLHQNTESENILKAKDEELHNLKQMLKEKMMEIEDLGKTNALLQQTGEGAESEKQRFEELLKSEREEIQSLYEQMNQLVSEKLDMEVNLEQKERDLRAAAEELRQFAADRDNLDEIMERCESLQVEVDTLKRDLTELRRRLHDKEERIKRLETESNEQEQEKTYLREELELSKGSIRSMDENIKVLEDQLEATKDNANILARELDSKREACTKLKDMCEEKDQLLLSLKETVNEISEEVSSYKKQCSSLQEQLKSYNAQLITKEQTDERVFSGELEMQINMLKDESARSLKNYTEQMALKDEAIAQKDKNIEMLRETVNELKVIIADFGKLERNETLTAPAESSLSKIVSDQEVAGSVREAVAASEKQLETLASVKVHYCAGYVAYILSVYSRSMYANFLQTNNDQIKQTNGAFY